MDLGAATHFSQGWSVEIVEPAQEIGVEIVRDSVNWAEIETERGVYDFSSTKAAYPGFLAVLGFDVRLVFPYGNPLYDGGATPHTDEGRAAFAEYVAQVLRRHPLVRTIEIGNEFNAQNFVSGPVAEAPYEERAGHYVRLLEAVYDRVKPEFPNVSILGGAAHSIPVHFLEAQAELGALEHSDGLAFHPYSSPPEHVGTHLEVLRAALAPVEPALHATEFGGDFETLEDAAPYLVKMASALSAAGVQSAIWYSLREQPWYEKMELLSADGAPRPAGESFAFMQREVLAHGDAERLPSDDMTHLYSFGDRALVAWGVPRAIAVDAEVEWRDARGRPIGAPEMLDPQEPVIALAETPVNFATVARLESQPTLTDSYFDFEPRADADGQAGAWSYHTVRGDGAVEPLSLMEGGTWQNEGWRPYIGDQWRRPLVVDESGLRPVDFSSETAPSLDYAIRERFTVPGDAAATICGVWRVREDSNDGIQLTVSVNDRTHFDQAVPDRVELRLDDVELKAGDTVDFVVGSRADPEGDWTRRHVRIVEAARADALCDFDE